MVRPQGSVGWNGGRFSGSLPSRTCTHALGGKIRPLVDHAAQTAAETGHCTACLARGTSCVVRERGHPAPIGAGVQREWQRTMEGSSKSRHPCEVKPDMGNWRHHVSIGIDDILEDESISVEQKGRMIADRLSREVCFHSFPYVANFRTARTADELDQWLERMYDYADRHRIWIR